MKPIIKPHHDCTEGRHVFIPIRWEENIKTQEKWVTEFSCQNCLEYVDAKSWGEYIKTTHADVDPEQAIKQKEEELSLHEVSLASKEIELAEKERLLAEEKIKLDEFYAKIEKDMAESKPAKKKPGRPAVKK